jgi:hypothetical protein
MDRKNVSFIEGYIHSLYKVERDKNFALWWYVIEDLENIHRDIDMSYLSADEDTKLRLNEITERLKNIYYMMENLLIE